jgi:hypothetical protein
METFFRATFKMGKDQDMVLTYSAIFTNMREIGVKIVLMEKENFIETVSCFFKEVSKTD